MGVKGRVNKSQSDFVSFLFEDKKVSYIRLQEKNNLDVVSFYIQNKSELSIKREIIQKLEENDFFDQKYSFIDISILNNKFTLIPMEHFSENTAETFLNLTVPFSKNSEIRFNLIPQFDLALVFYYPEKIETFFKNSSDKIRITHTGFKFLSKIKNSQKENGVFLNTSHEHFEVAVVENEKLILYNVYPYAVVQDIAYFLQVISKNINISFSTFDLYYFGNVEYKKGNLAKLSLDFKTVKIGIEDEYERANFTTLDLL